MFQIKLPVPFKYLTLALVFFSVLLSDLQSGHFLSIFCFICYIVGGIPFSLIIVKYFEKKDLRQIGSGNIGTTNVLRTSSKKIAFLVLVLDVLKGFLPGYIALKVFNFDYSVALFSTLFAVLGQIFSCWLQFKGGKGVATSFGGILFFAPWPVITFAVFAWAIIFYFSRVSSLSTLLTVVMTFILFYGLGGSDYSWLLRQKDGGLDSCFAIYIFLLTPLLFYSHRSNIMRLIKKEELKF